MFLVKIVKKVGPQKALTFIRDDEHFLEQKIEIGQKYYVLTERQLDKLKGKDASNSYS